MPITPRGHRASSTSERLLGIQTAAGPRPMGCRSRPISATFADMRPTSRTGRGFTFTVLDPVADVVIGCVYLYPTTSADHDVTVQSWVRADRAELDVPLADAVAAWLAADWPWERVDRCGR